MSPHFDTEHVTVWHGDCIDVMRQMPDASIDAVVTDPPYSLEFMGKAWDRHEDEDAGFGYYLAGLIDGEGHFRVDAKGRRCEFTLKLRDDDEWILRRAMAFIGHGRIAHEPRTGTSNSMATLVIDTKDGVGALCSLLLRYPLRAKKLRDFIVWAEAVDEWLTMERGNRWHGVADRTRLRVLGERLREGRSYSEVSWSGNGFQDWCRQWASEALRVLKPGGHLLSFGGTRTQHRMVAGIEDAGFEIRDAILWVFGSGFPKSLDVSKAIDRMAGAEREAGPIDPARAARLVNQTADYITAAGWSAGNRKVTIDPPATPDAARWQGWGTALKPATEIITVARKPLAGTVAANVLQYGTGALNIDASRIGFRSEADKHANDVAAPGLRDSRSGFGGGMRTAMQDAGRWPANVVLDASQADALDAQSGDRKSSGVYGGDGILRPGTHSTDFGGGNRPAAMYDDQGGASRFFKTVDDVAPRFMYTAKAGSDERPNVDGIAHPTVKSLDLMRWLVKLVTPKGGTVLEPFAGSGTTVEAAVLEGFRCIAIEREADYLPLIMQRVSKPHAVGLDFGDWEDVS